MAQMNVIDPDFSGDVTIKSSRMTGGKKWILLRDVMFS